MCMFDYPGFIAFIIVFGVICHQGDINFQDCNCYSRCGFTLFTWSLFFFVVSSCSRHHLITDWSQSNACFNKVSIHQRLSEWNITEEAVATKTLCLKRQNQSKVGLKGEEPEQLVTSRVSVKVLCHPGHRSKELGKQRLNWAILFHVKHYTVHMLITRAFFNTNSKPAGLSLSVVLLGHMFHFTQCHSCTY